jgi:hypothetical protein
VPEMLTEDEVREAFARLRAAELPRVPGPGTAAIERTVRRRRATTSAAVLLIALAVAGGAAFAVRTGTPRPAPPPPPAAPEPVPTGPDLIRLGEQASLALDPVVPGDYAAGVSGPLTGAVLDAHEATQPAGRYRLAATCVGTGTARFEVVQNRQAEGFDLVCDGRAGSLEFVYQPAFTLYVSVEPDAAADGHAGFAYRVDDVP